MSIRRVLVASATLVVIAAGCSSSSEDASTTTAAADTSTTTTIQATTTTTTAAPTTTTAAPTTTTTAPTTTSAAAVSDATPVAATPIVGTLQGYSLGGEALFPAESVEAHWYQWDGLYVVLYRGFDASSGEPICAGNSILEADGRFANISNSPHEGTVAEICDGVPKVADAPSGVYACGALLYYLTEIPTETVGKLFGTLEIVKAGTADGQTSLADSDIAATPEFEPGLGGYDLPPSIVDDGGAVTCG